MNTVRDAEQISREAFEAELERQASINRAMVARAALMAVQKGDAEIPLQMFEHLWRQYFYDNTQVQEQVQQNTIQLHPQRRTSSV